MAPFLTNHTHSSSTDKPEMPSHFQNFRTCLPTNQINSNFQALETKIVVYVIHILLTYESLVSGGRESNLKNIQAVEAILKSPKKHSWKDAQELAYP